MKKTLLYALMWLLPAMAVVAQPAVGKGRENKFVSPAALMQGTYLGVHNRMEAWVVEGKKQQQRLVMLDGNMVPQFEVVLPDSKETRVLSTTMSDAKANILVVNEGEKRQTLVGRYGLRLDNYTVDGGMMDTLLRLEYGKKDECMVWGSSSANGEYVGVVAIVKYKENSLYRTVIALYDNDLNKLWEREFGLATMSQMLVSDEGRIVTLGLEEEGEESILVFNTITETESHTWRAAVKCDGVRTLQLAAVHGDRVLAMGSFGVPGGKKTRGLTGGVMAMSFDVSRGELVDFNMRAFQNEDANIFLNVKTKKIQKELNMPSINMVACAPTSYGCAALFAQQYGIQYEDNTGSKKLDYCSVGLHCVAVDMNGQFKWVRNLRSNLLEEEDNCLINASLVETNNATNIITVEHPKSPATYDIAKEQKQLTIGNKGNLVLYAIADDGNVKKTVLEKEAKFGVLCSVVHGDGNVMIFEGRENKTRAIDLRFTY